MNWYKKSHDTEPLDNEPLEDVMLDTLNLNREKPTPKIRMKKRKKEHNWHRNTN